ncbi:alpha/beta hydrolase [Paenibacillus sambharensis]|uniref:Alpha/beta hydrolase n=1 Tax=Paenibacillus sambharensis TaxID=1803190 RepID=A0A2W1LF35_9BACL|nr:alpha/beta fold hydrolase [Paenibacillus sambharensis]PZD97299.1 alpha/beta hydrolase [Paenibacillus sambharensis]
MHISRNVDNRGVGIHYIDSIDGSDPSLIPLVISPGLSETAEEYLELLEHMRPRRCVVLSYRGRGGSDTPVAGYNLADHITDLASVIREAGLERYHMMGYSRGVSYALGYVLEHQEQVHSLIIEDYPAEHKQMPDGWAEDYIHNYLIPYYRTDNIRPEAVWGIQRESTQQQLDKELDLPVLVQKGKLEGSLLNEEHIQGFKEIYQNVVIKEYYHSGHDIRSSEKLALYQDIKDFLAGVEK